MRDWANGWDLNLAEGMLTVIGVPVEVGYGSVVGARVEHDQVEKRAKREGSPDAEAVVHVDLSVAVLARPLLAARVRLVSTDLIGIHSKYALTAFIFR